MSYSTHSNIVTGKPVNPSDIREMDEQIKKNEESIIALSDSIQDASDCEAISSTVYDSKTADELSKNGLSRYNFPLMLCGRNLYIDFDTTSGTLTIPVDTLAFGKDIGGSGVDWVQLCPTDGSMPNGYVVEGVSQSAAGTSAIIVYFNSSTKVIGTKKYSAKLNDGEYAIAMIRTKYTSTGSKPVVCSPLPWSVDGNPYGIEIGASQDTKYKYPVMITGNNRYIDYDTTAGTITIPKNTIIFGKGVGGSSNYKFLVSDSDKVITGVTVSNLGTIAINIVWNKTTDEYSKRGYNYQIGDDEYVICSVRLPYNNSFQPSLATPVPWSVNGNPYGIDLSQIASGSEVRRSFVRGVNHRGYNTVAPENTLSAFKLSAEHGFKYIECDVQFTSDGVPVICHDTSINRTSNGTGNIREMTLETLRTYDFGSWKNSRYAGEQIPTLEEVFALCKKLGLHPYIELPKTSAPVCTESMIASCVALAKKYGMLRNCTWISYTAAYLGYIKNADPKARLGFLIGTVAESTITTVNGLKNDQNDVFIDYNVISDAMIARCIEEDIPIEVYTVDSATTIKALNMYVSGVTSDSIDASVVLAEEV